MELDISLSFDFQSHLARQVISPTVMIAYIVELPEFELGLSDFKTHTLSGTPHGLPATGWASVMGQLLCRQLLILDSGKQLRFFSDKHV